MSLERHLTELHAASYGGELWGVDSATVDFDDEHEMRRRYPRLAARYLP
jgi:hypothetical protein